MKNFFKKLFCFHLNWRTPIVLKKYPAWNEREWACTRCDKRIVMSRNEQPIQYIEN